MSTEIKTNAALEVINKGGLEKTTADNIFNKFQGFFKTASEWEIKARQIVVTDEKQVAEMKMAGEARKFIKKVRLEIEETRKGLKDEYLRTGKVIDSVANILKAIVEPIETYLGEQENFAEIQAAKRKEQLRKHRSSLLSPYEVNPALYDLGNMPEEQFTTILEASKNAYDKKKADEKAAAEKAKAEEAEKLKREKELIKENERLKKENERKAAEAKAAKEKADALAKQSREKEAAEKKVADEKAKAEKKAAAAPDKEKAMKYIDSVITVPAPDIKDAEILTLIANFNSGIVTLANKYKSLIKNNE